MIFTSLPQSIQNAISTAATAAGYEDIDQESFTQKSQASLGNDAAGAPVYLGGWLNYDFNESNFDIFLINLVKIDDVDLGPMSAALYKKSDPALPAYFVTFSEQAEHGENLILECV